MRDADRERLDKLADGFHDALNFTLSQSLKCLARGNDVEANMWHKHYLKLIEVLEHMEGLLESFEEEIKWKKEYMNG